MHRPFSSNIKIIQIIMGFAELTGGIKILNMY